MFCVIFEVCPKPGQQEAYLDHAKILRPELEQMDGFIDNVRYRSLTREGWLLSVSGWRDEKSLVRWRTRGRHHRSQAKGRAEILADYHLRVGQLTQDNSLRDGHTLHEQRLDETEIGDGKAIVLIDAKRPPEWVQQAKAHEVAACLGLVPDTPELVAWDVFDAILTPGDIILLSSWSDKAAADAFAQDGAVKDGARRRQIRVVRDYGMFDRREAPQYYPDAPGGRTIHA